jgi:dienelactone hydrolase
VAEARRLAGARAARVGLHGSSQGGWIAPYAAALAPVDFVISAYGMLEAPLAEDAGEVRQSLIDKGHGPEVLAKARELSDATGRVMVERSPEALAAFDRVREKYRAEPWLADVEGEFTHMLLKFPSWLIPIVGPVFDVGTSWQYDPMPVQRALKVPRLWILAAEDREAPHEETLARLQALQKEGHTITVAVFPATDHGILEFEVRDGKRVSTRYAEGYFPLIVDWVRDGRARGEYGRARLLRTAGSG